MGAYLRVMDKSTSFAVGRLLAGGGILEALDDGRLSGPVVSNDESEGCVE